MLELLFVLYILVLFIFPLPALVLTLSAGTLYLLHRKYQLLQIQPPEGKKIIWISALTRTGNFIASILVSTGMALLVHLLIFRFTYLFIFNWIFCFLISLRWFDFTHRLFRYHILKLIHSPHPRIEEDQASVFVQCLGLRKNVRIGTGLTPVFIDAGYLSIEDNILQFAGVFFNQRFEPGWISRAEKSSAEKIRLFPSSSPPPWYPDAFLIILKEELYPFRSRKKRDRIFQQIQSLQEKQPHPAG